MNAVTKSEKLQLIEALLTEFPHKGKLYLRGHQSKPVLDEENLQVIAKQFCMWLGLKPSNLSVRFAHLPGAVYRYSVHDYAHVVTIDECLAPKPLLCAALVARGCSEYYLRRRRYSPLESEHAHNELIDLTTVHLGFGITTLNGTPRSSRHSSRFHDTVRWIFTGRPLFSASRYYHTGEYAELVHDFVKKHAIPPQLFILHIRPEVTPYLPDGLRPPITI